MLKLIKVKKKHMLQLLIIIAIVTLGMIIVYYASPRTVAAAEAVATIPPESSRDMRWVWNELPPTVTTENNLYGGARRWNLTDDLALHMCWCYGMRVTRHNPEIRYNGESFEGHYFWSREDGADLVFTDFKSYIAVFDYERRITSTFAREGTRSYRFSDWSVYFFANGLLTIVDSEGSVVAMNEGTVTLNPDDEWRFEVSLAYLIHMDQQFMRQLLANRLPWAD